MPRSLPALLAALLLSLCAAAPAAADEIDRKEAELERLRERIEQVRKTLETAEERKGGVLRQLRDIERKIGEIDHSLRDTRESLREQRARLRELQRQRTRQQAELEAQRETLAGQIRAAYAMGRQEQVKLLLNQRDPARVHRTFVYYDYLHRARTRVIHSAVEQLKALRATEAAIREQTERLDTLIARRERERSVLETSRGERETILAALTEQMRDQGSELEELRSGAKRLQSLLDSLQQALADIPDEPEQVRPFAALRGEHPWPVAGKVRRLYGSPRGGAGLRWTGVLIEAPAGQEVRAVAAGRVAFADWLRGQGLLVILDHGEGFMTLYAHNQALYRETGEWVSRGDVIASVGNSGGREQAGLYFEIRRNGRPQDPAKWCRTGASFASR